MRYIKRTKQLTTNISCQNKIQRDVIKATSANTYFSTASNFNLLITCNYLNFLKIWRSQDKIFVQTFRESMKLKFK